MGVHIKRTCLAIAILVVAVVVVVYAVLGISSSETGSLNGSRRSVSEFNAENGHAGLGGVQPESAQPSPPRLGTRIKARLSVLGRGPTGLAGATAVVTTESGAQPYRGPIAEDNRVEFDLPRGVSSVTVRVEGFRAATVAVAGPTANASLQVQDLGTVTLIPESTLLGIRVLSSLAEDVDGLNLSIRAERDPSFVVSCSIEPGQTGFFAVPPNSELHVLITSRDAFQFRVFPPPEVSPGSIEVCTVDLRQACSYGVRLIDVPWASGLHVGVRQLFASDRESPGAFFTVGTGDSGAFSLKGLNPAAVGVLLDLVTDGLSVPLVDASSGAAHLPACPPDSGEVQVRPARAVVGIELATEYGGQILSYDFRLRPDDPLSPFPRPGGMALVLEDRLRDATHIEFLINGMGYRRFRLEEGVRTGNTLKFVVRDGQDCAGKVVIAWQLPRNGRRGAAFPGVEMIASHGLESLHEGEGAVRQTEDGVVFAGLCPGQYDLYWTWERRGRRMALSGIAVTDGSEVELQVQRPALVEYAGLVQNWEGIPIDLRPMGVYVDGCLFDIEDGRFEYFGLDADPYELVWRCAGRSVKGGDYRIDHERQVLVTTFDYGELRAIPIRVSSAMGGRLHAACGSELSFAPLVGVGWGGGQTAFFDERGEYVFVGSEGLPLRCLFWENPGGLFRGWVADLGLGGGLDLPGRHVPVTVLLPDKYPYVEIVLRGEVQGWQPPLVSLGLLRNGANHDLWIPSTSTEILAYDGDALLARSPIEGSEGVLLQAE